MTTLPLPPLLVALPTLFLLAACSQPDSETKAAAASGTHIWWEAEEPALSNFPAGHGEEGAGGNILSAGKWIGVMEGWTETPYLEYTVEIPKGGDFKFYVRKFWKHGPFRWRFNDGAWNNVGKDPALLDDEPIRQFWGANWIQAGPISLPAGTHRLRVEVTDSVKPAYFDCFYLTDQPFFPMGQHKPWEPLPKAHDGWWTFNNYKTLFASSPIDLRSLNEAQAGDGGFISVRGAEFVQGDRPIRFLAVGASRETTRLPREMIDTLAKFLARHGVNLVRFHSPFFVRNGPNAGQVDAEDLDNVFYFIHAMKREGIYTHLSIYFPVWFRLNGHPDFPEYSGNDTPPFAIQFFNPKFQAMEREWWKVLLTTVNPYSGIPLNQDPAIMGVEILNEDSLFFWTFDYKRVPEAQMALLESQFAAWAKAKHGSVAKALAAWATPHPRDDVRASRLGIVSLWELFNAPLTAREQDTAEFLARVQRRYFDDKVRLLREELGFKATICGSNWRTANTATLGALDKWTQAGADFFDHHGYFGSWSKREPDGRRFYAMRSLSAWDSAPGEARRRLDLPFLSAQIAGKPGMVSEYAWMGQNPARAEMPLIVSTLASQAGLDAMALFALSSNPAWRSNVQHSWPVATPSSMGLFAAKALVFRKRMVPETPPLTQITINVGEMMALKGNAFTDPSSNDANRAAEGQDTSRHGVPLAAFAHGRVAVDFTESAPSSLQQVEPGLYHDAEAGRLRSHGDQIDWHYKRGIYTVRAALTQGVSGYLARAGKVELPDLTVESSLPFGVVWAVSMDDQPLATSRKILLQVMSEERNHDAHDYGETKIEVLDEGHSPIEVRNLTGVVRFTRADAAKLRVTALDINGVPKGKAGSAEVLRLQPDTISYLIESR